MPGGVTDRLLEFLGPVCRARMKRGEALHASTPLFSSRLVDSMGLVELLACVEREFGVVLDVTLDELAGMDTAEQLSQRIEQLRHARPRA